MKTKDSKPRRSQLGFALIAASGIAAGISQANPSESDATIAAGTAIFDANGNLLQITTSDMTIIDWLSFNIGVGETVQFIMPDATSRVLNRIDGATPSEINGTLTANGQVFLVNPSGIVFGENAVVNAGSLYAAAGHISNADFISETYRFTDMHGAVINRGFLQGDLVALLGGEVANIGSISAPEGTVIMAAGEQVLIGTHLGNKFVEIEIPLHDSEALLDIEDDSLQLAAGDIYSIAAWNSGSITGDQVIIQAEGGDVGISGSINATGSNNDGFLTVQGDNVLVTRNLETRGVPITGSTITLTAAPGGLIDLGADLHSTGSGIYMNGDVRLTESVQLLNTGLHSNTRFEGNVYSEINEFNTLSILSTSGQTYFGGTIGVDPTSDQRLGFLDIDAASSTYWDNVSTRDGMTLMGYTQIQGPSVTFHTGTGSALFGGNIYSYILGASDIAFEYDGEVWTGVGEERTPFKFSGHIGAGPIIHTVPNQGAFRNIRFGNDLTGGSLVASSFLFSNAVVEGLDLMNASAIDLSSRFNITATEGIYAGRGQKITSFGDIQFGAKSLGTTTIQLSDVNALGDIRILSLGRTAGNIDLFGHLGGLIDGVLNEGDRAGGGYNEQGAELIASGSIFMSGTVNVDSAGALLGANSVVLANNGGTGSPLGLTVQEFPGGVSLANFMGNQLSTSLLVYGYDLTLGEFDPVTPPTQANLATALADEDILRLRDDLPYLAGRQVLVELGLAPIVANDSVIRDGMRLNSERYAVQGDSVPSVTIDRLSPRSVTRLADAYIGLFGVRDPDTGIRSGIKGIASDLASGDEDEVDILMSKIGLVLDRISLLELTPLEIDRAKTNLLNMIRPDSVDETQFRSQWVKN